MQPTAAYPVRVQAGLDPRLSRWLWLVKWLLAIPHYVVLILLWIAFWIITIIAFFAILITTHYPRALFEFNLGVLRWTWRVGYYSYSALGTDRYPPFTLAEVPDYPAQLHIPYPQHLSRGLVLVKWWLLAIPHYLILGIFLGSGVILSRYSDTVLNPGTGLLTLLVLFAAIALLCTTRYPQGIYDLVLGINRWALRVAAYAWLMTDAYPPLRLDLGGTDPAPLPPPSNGLRGDHAQHEDGAALRWATQALHENGGRSRERPRSGALTGPAAKGGAPVATAVIEVAAETELPVSPSGQLRDPLPPWVMVLLGLAATAVLGTVVWSTTQLHPEPGLRSGALFVHLAALVVGFGAVLTVDWMALLWLLKRRSLGALTNLAAAAHPLIWLGLVGLVLSGAVCKPDLSAFMTWVKMTLVLLVTLNGLHVYAIGERLARVRDGVVPRHLLRRAGAAAAVSQLGWWGAMIIGFINTQ